MKSHQPLIFKSGVFFSIVLFFLLSFQSSYSQTTITITDPNTTSVTIPAGASSIIVEVWGAGGAGGSTSKTPGGGGGGGAYSRSISGFSSGTFPIQIGAGAPTPAKNASGTAGGNTWFINSGTIYAEGGSGGTGAGGAGGSAGNGVGNDLTLSGGDGIGSGGDGGNGANGGVGGTGGAVGGPGSPPGGGGGGGDKRSFGGAGADGQIIITFTLSVSCNLSATGLTNILCNDNGTPANPNDDTFTFDLNPTGSNLDATYSISGGITQVGILYGVRNFGPYPISGGNLNITITDGADGSCTIADTVIAPATCSGAVCSIASSGLINIICDDNGTPTIPGDDVYYFDLNPTGATLGASYSISGDITQGGISYGSATNFGPYPISGGNLNITITDDTDGVCIKAETVVAPIPCSIPVCNLSTTGLTNIICNDNGTSANSSDDTFTFDLNPTGADLGLTYNVTGDVTQAGVSYGSATSFGPFPISGGNLTITITDVSTDCTIASFVVTPPASCSNGCDLISAGLSNLVCNDEKSLTNEADDTFSFNLNPTGANIGGTYSVSGDITQNNISYGSATTFSGYLISGGNLNITIIDDSDGTCQIVVIVTPPMPCSLNHSPYNCSSCHILHDAPGLGLTSVAGNALLCQSCHISTGLAGGKSLVNANIAIPGVSGNSHAWDVPADNPGYQTVIPDPSTEMGKRLPGGNIVCSTCHNQHNNGSEGSPYLRADNTGDAMCKTCHFVRDVQLYSAGPTNRGSHPVGIVYDVVSSKLNASPSKTQMVDGKVECSSCHGLHDIAGGTLTNDGNLLRMFNDVNLCMDCHNYGGHGGFDCNVCHETHNTVDGVIGNNILMVRDIVETPMGPRDVVYTARSGPNSFVDSDNTYDGICEVCHTGLRHDNTDGTGSNPTPYLHDDGSDKRGETCLGCHLHKDDFTQPTGPLTCVSCHATAQVSSRETIITRPVPGVVNAIVGDGSEYDNALSSRHTSLTGEDPDNAECEACHFDAVGSHPVSVIGLRDQNSGLLFSNSDSDIYCIQCHDGDAPTSIVDFSYINTAIYNKASYIATPHDTGDNSCLACHKRHGSANAGLTNQATNYENCFECHDGSVASTTISIADIANPVGGIGNGHAFNVPAGSGLYESNLPTDPAMVARLGAGNILECSTCHDPHDNANGMLLVSANGSDQMCKDCHKTKDKGAYASNTALNRGTHPVGITYPGTPSYKPGHTLPLVGGNVECSSCHGVHNTVTNDGNLLKMTNDNNLCKDCHDYLPHQGFDCLDCHQAHGGTNIMLIKSTINGLPVVMDSQTGLKSFADGDGTLDGVCEVCHTTLLYHNNTDDLTDHNDGSSCIGCHSHNGLPPPGDPQIVTSFPNGSCHSCHESTGPADPNVYPMTGAHEAHSGALYMYKCSECHFEYGEGGALEGAHSNSSIDVNFDPNGLASRFGQDPGLGFGTPTWDAGTKTCSNIYCHSNGQSADRGQDVNHDWTNRGTKGPQPPVYASPVWTDTITTCGACHGGKGNMTAPYTITMASPPEHLISTYAEASGEAPASGLHTHTGMFNDNQEKSGPAGFGAVQCFLCHNVNGAAHSGTNYQGTYGSPQKLHVDGQTYFNMKIHAEGGTWADWNGTAANGYLDHCIGKANWN
ncbi:MAG: CxxxxCH/CxxCH domain-containing protein [Flavobacteriaceae bacterium]|nr:CxxxxCH/CxxCH domain-containing protein [Flavobacteriaceae bacterium]